MSSRSLSVATDKYSVIEGEMISHIHSVVESLINMDLKAKTLSIYVYPSRYSDFIMRGFSREVSFDLLTNDLFSLVREGIKLLKGAYKIKVPYQKVGVVVSGLRSTDSLPSSLFSDEVNQRTQELSDLVFSINTKYQRGIELGRLPKGRQEKIVSKKHLSPAYTTKWTDLKVVKT